MGFIEELNRIHVQAGYEDGVFYFTDHTFDPIEKVGEWNLIKNNHGVELIKHPLGWKASAVGPNGEIEHAVLNDNVGTAEGLWVKP